MSGHPSLFTSGLPPFREFRLGNIYWAGVPLGVPTRGRKGVTARRRPRWPCGACRAGCSTRSGTAKGRGARGRGDGRARARGKFEESPNKRGATRVRIGGVLLSRRRHRVEDLRICFAVARERSRVVVWPRRPRASCGAALSFAAGASAAIVLRAARAVGVRARARPGVWDRTSHSVTAALR